MQTFSERTVRAELTTFRIARMYRLGTRRLSRAHLALAQRPEVAARLGAIGKAACDAVAAHLGQPIEARFSLLDNVFTVERNVAPGCALALVDLDGAGNSAILEIEKPLLGVLLERLSGGPARFTPATRLTRIEEAAFGFLTLLAVQAARGEELIERLFAPRVRAVNPEWTDLVAATQGFGPLLGIRFALRVGDVDGQGRFFIPTRILKMALETQPASEPAALPNELASANLTLRSFTGTLQLRADELRTIRPGDVVLFDELKLLDGAVLGPVRLQCPSFELFGSFSPEGFTVSRAAARQFPQESLMAHPNPAAEVPALPVEVEVELTRLRLTVAELANIRAGSILPLRINGTDPVVLRIGDRAVARAELVEIEGEVGARILSLLS